MNAQIYFGPLREAFDENRNSNAAVLMSKYLRGQFEFYGLTSALRRNLQKQFYKTHGYPPAGLLSDYVKFLWESNEREWQYVGMELAVRFTRKESERILQLSEYMITHKSWWDTVDLIATKIVGSALSVFPELIPLYPDRWIASKDLWLKRSALLFQLKYKTATDTDLLFNYILRCTSMKEFFISKAIGWALREYSKTVPAIVQDFVESHQLQPLSRKEALKIVSKGN
jgi:3-methyladenine DNA glycosylase AlkD